MPDFLASEIASAANTLCRRWPSVGFICWSSVEIGRILEIARNFESGCIVIGRRKGRGSGSGDPIFKLEESVFTDAAVPVVVWPEERMLEFNGFFDVIVCQVPFIGIEQIKQSRVFIVPEGADCRAVVESSMKSLLRE